MEALHLTKLTGNRDLIFTRARANGLYSQSEREIEALRLTKTTRKFKRSYIQQNEGNIKTLNSTKRKANRGVTFN